jgi:hypothetical protein
MKAWIYNAMVVIRRFQRDKIKSPVSIFADRALQLTDNR